MAKKRDYKKEYRDFHGKPKQIKLRCKRDKARREMAAQGRVKKGDGKEVDHIRPLSKGGSNSKKNIRIVKQSTNRRKGSKLMARKPTKRSRLSGNKKKWVTGAKDGFMVKGKKVSRATFKKAGKVPASWVTEEKRNLKKGGSRARKSR